MKKHNTLKVVLITLCAFLVCSWIFTSAYYSGGYVDQGRVQMGLFDIFSYPTTALSYFGYISLYVLAMGMFYGVLNKISAYRVLIDKLAKAFKGKEKLAVAIIASVLAVITSFAGIQLALLIVFPFVISLVLVMGYDKIVAALTTVGGVLIGYMGTTFAYSNTNVLVSTLGIKVTAGIAYKIIILVLGLALLIFNIFMYINKKMPKKTKENTKDIDVYVPSVVNAKESKGAKIWPLVLVLDLFLIISVMAFIPWSAVFNITMFDDVTTAITGFTVPVYVALLVLLLIINLVLFGKKQNKHAYIIDAAVVILTLVLLIGRFLVKAASFKAITKGLNVDFAIFGKFLGSVNSFGNWSLTEISLLAILSALLLAVIYKVKLDDVFDGVVEGIKRAIMPAAFVLLVYFGLVIVTYHPFQLPIYKAVFGLTKGFNVFTSTIVAMLATLFNSDPLYVFNSVIPYLISLVTKTEVYPVIWILYQSVSGLTMLVAPTSLILVVTLYYLDIPYGKWLKTIWKLVVEILVLLLIVCTIALMIV